jgi:hypothetical protein
VAVRFPKIRLLILYCAQRPVSSETCNFNVMWFYATEPTARRPACGEHAGTCPDTGGGATLRSVWHSAHRCRWGAARYTAARTRPRGTTRAPGAARPRGRTDPAPATDTETTLNLQRLSTLKNALDSRRTD